MRSGEVTIGSTPAHGSRTFRAIHCVTYVGIPAHAAFVGLFFWLGVPLLAWFNVGSVIAWLAARALNARRRRHVPTALLVGEVVLHAVLAVSILGWSSGFHYYLL